MSEIPATFSTENKNVGSVHEKEISPLIFDNDDKGESEIEPSVDAPIPARRKSQLHSYMYYLLVGCVVIGVVLIYVGVRVYSYFVSSGQKSSAVIMLAIVPYVLYYILLGGAVYMYSE
jgi:hypothetical protein